MSERTHASDTELTCTFAPDEYTTRWDEDDVEHETEGPGAPLISEDGSWMRPSELSGRFRSLKVRLGLDPALTFHSLRHTYATTLLMAGADPKSVSEQMGHADVAITLRIYGHVIPGRGAQLASMASDAYRQMTRG